SSGFVNRRSRVRFLHPAPALIPKAIPTLSTARPTQNVLGYADSSGTNSAPVYLETVFQILREEEHGTPAASVAGVYFYLPQAIAAQAPTFSP
ncbi:MAG: hypothetical protein V4491_09795, partial [Pseudomonadota bacterium]